jgi:hypothetical protein
MLADEAQQRSQSRKRTITWRSSQSIRRGKADVGVAHRRGEVQLKRGPRRLKVSYKARMVVGEVVHSRSSDDHSPRASANGLVQHPCHRGLVACIGFTQPLLPQHQANDGLPQAEHRSSAYKLMECWSPTASGPETRCITLLRPTCFLDSSMRRRDSRTSRTVRTVRNSTISRGFISNGASGIIKETVSGFNRHVPHHPEVQSSQCP